MQYKSKIQPNTLINSSLILPDNGFKVPVFKPETAYSYDCLKKTMLDKLLTFLFSMLIRLFVFFILMMIPQCDNYQPQLVIYENHKTEINIETVNVY